MDFDFNPDQQLLAEALAKWADSHREIAADERTAAWLDGSRLADELREQGYLEAAGIPDLGLLGALLLVEAAGRVPRAVEIAASGLVVPALGLELTPAPVAILSAKGNRVARFLVPSGNALIDCGDHVRLAEAVGEVEVVKSTYAYPLGRLTAEPAATGRELPGVAPARLRCLTSLAQIAETVAAMEAALSLTLDHVTSREQFGRPIGSFQAVQHRLGECSALVTAARWLMYRAASEDADAGLVGEAAIVAHDAMRRVIYETTQFHGALGLTLEYPLHLWTYRLRSLQTGLASAAAEASR